MSQNLSDAYHTLNMGYTILKLDLVEDLDQSWIDMQSYYRVLKYNKTNKEVREEIDQC